ncbi:MAG: transglutaminase domain-containing protein [Dehalococcoidia bacterium]|nr:transglutaminase domain-containing protein [Dehalococcoidia bacterium]
MFDDWDVCRTRGDGEDGFLHYVGGRFDPVIAAESLGANANRAYVRGLEFQQEYPDIEQRAEAIFGYAQSKVRYTSDRSQFGYMEFAQNADELLAVIDEEGIAYGDCEDYAVLLGVMYLGAGIRSAVVLAPEHAAALVYVPGYAGANRQLSLDGESGWVWAEATGGNNPFGWMPEQYMNAELQAQELVDEGLVVEALPDKPVVTISRHTGSRFVLPVSPFFLVVGLLWLISSVGRRRSR